MSGAVVILGSVWMFTEPKNVSQVVCCISNKEMVGNVRRLEKNMLMEFVWPLEHMGKRLGGSPEQKLWIKYL